MFLALLLFWVVFNGRITLEILLVGAAVSAVLTRFWKKLFGGTGRLLPSAGVLWRYFKYVCGLTLEIISCSIKVMHLVLHPEEEVRPQLLTFRTGLREDSHRVVLANSITLTPGTITVGLQGDLIRVHGLDASFLEGIEDCDMVRRLKQMEEAE